MDKFCSKLVFFSCKSLLLSKFDAYFCKYPPQVASDEVDNFNKTVMFLNCIELHHIMDQTRVLLNITDL